MFLDDIESREGRLPGTSAGRLAAPDEAAITAAGTVAVDLFSEMAQVEGAGNAKYDYGAEKTQHQVVLCKEAF